MGRNIGTGGNIIQPEKLEEYGNFETCDHIAGNGTPKSSDHERPLKEAGIYCKAEKRKNRKKKPTTATQTGNDNANP